jgi:hypothetical protein
MSSDHRSDLIERIARSALEGTKFPLDEGGLRTCYTKLAALEQSTDVTEDVIFLIIGWDFRHSPIKEPPSSDDRRRTLNLHVDILKVKFPFIELKNIPLWVFVEEYKYCSHSQC